MKYITSIIILLSLLVQTAIPVSATERIQSSSESSVSESGGSYQSIASQLKSVSHQLTILELRARLAYLIGLLEKKPASFTPLEGQISSTQSKIVSISSSISRVIDSAPWGKDPRIPLANASEELKYAIIKAVQNNDPSESIKQAGNYVNNAINIIGGDTEQSSSKVEVIIPSTVKLGEFIGPSIWYEGVDKVEQYFKCSNPSEMIVDGKGGLDCDDYVYSNVTADKRMNWNIGLHVLKAPLSGTSVAVRVVASKNGKIVYDRTYDVKVEGITSSSSKLNQSLSPYTSGRNAGVTSTWSPFSGASKYRITHYRKDTAGQETVTRETTGTSFSTGTFENAGESMGYCYYHKINVEALASNGSVLSSQSKDICVRSNGAQSGTNPQNYVAPSKDISLDVIRTVEEGSPMWVTAKFGAGITKLKLYASCNGVTSGTVNVTSCDGTDRFVQEVNVSGLTYKTWNFDAGMVSGTSGSYRFRVDAYSSDPGVGSVSRWTTVTKKATSDDPGVRINPPLGIKPCYVSLTIPQHAVEGSSYTVSWKSEDVSGQVALYNQDVFLGNYPANASYTEGAGSSISSTQTFKVVGQNIEKKVCSDTKSFNVYLPGTMVQGPGYEQSASVKSSSSSQTILNALYQRLLQLKIFFRK